jgi:DNA ligase-1
MQFSTLSEHLANIESEDSRLTKTWNATQLLRAANDDELPVLLLFLQSRIFPPYDDRDIGLANKSVAKALAKAYNLEQTEVVTLWKETGDLGETAETISQQSNTLAAFASETNTASHSVQSIYNTFTEIAATEGTGSESKKFDLFKQMITAMDGNTARYATRLAVQDLRVGIGEGTIRDAIAWAFLDEAQPNYDEETQGITPDDRDAYDEAIEAVQSAIDKTNDFAYAANKAKDGLSALQAITITPGKPVKVMLAQRSETLNDAFETVGRPAAFEYKYDGMRMQIHYDNDDLHIFTRSLEDVTEQFPEVKTYLEAHIDLDANTSFVLDAEAVSYNADTKEYEPFQTISQRIKRKYNIEQHREEHPVEVNVFDILYLNGEELVNNTYQDRRETINELIDAEQYNLRLADQRITGDDDDAEAFFEEATERGNEGLMIKNVDGTYKPGSRVGYMLKYKSTMDDLDLVIIGAEWGQGKRSGWLTSYLVACRDGDNYHTVGRVATGLKEKPEEGLSFKEMTELLEPHVVSESGREVTVSPEVVIEVRFEEIQESPDYESGYALRFPRVISLRDDRSPENATTKEEIKEMYNSQ